MVQRRVFYSFDFEIDVMRVQQIRHIGTIEKNKPFFANPLEKVRRGGKRAIKQWIDENMIRKSCIVVLIGSETADREWVRYEIKKAWNDGRGLVGVYIHNLNCPRSGRSWMGDNPFANFNVDGTTLDQIVPCYDPTKDDAYNSIRDNIEDWIEEGISVRNSY